MSPNDDQPLALAELIGANVKRLRTAREWSQRDLLMSLRNEDANWSRATVGLLESDGIRGERLSDLAALCAALQVSLWDLLDGAGEVALRDGNVKDVDWVARSLRGKHSAADGVPDLLGIGRHDPDLTLEWARKVGLTPNKFESFLGVLAEYLGISLHPLGSASVLRDSMAGVRVGMTRETVRAKRGHATRKILKAAEIYRETPGRNAIERAVDVVWPSEVPDGMESDHGDH